MTEQSEAKREAKHLEELILEDTTLLDDPFVRGMLAAFYTIALGVTYWKAISIIRRWSACLVGHISTEG